MSEYYHRYHLQTNLYRGSTDDISDAAFGYTQTEFPVVEMDPLERFWRWEVDHWVLITSDEYNLLRNQE
jgi:hypothetical protein